MTRIKNDIVARYAAFQEWRQRRRLARVISGLQVSRPWLAHQCWSAGRGWR